MPALPLSLLPLEVKTPLPVLVIVKFPPLIEPECPVTPMVSVRPEATFQVWLVPSVIVPQSTVRLTFALARLMPLLNVSVVPPPIKTGAAGLLMTMPDQVTAAPSVLVAVDWKRDR